MRLRDIKKILEDNIPKLINLRENTIGAQYELTNIPEAVDALVNLEVFDFLSDEIAAIKQVKSVYYSRLPTMYIDSSTYSSFMSQYNSIRIKCNAVLKAINQAIPDQDENSISVKLPPINNLSELSKFTSDIDKALNQAIANDYIKGQVQLQNFDSGSYWFEIILGSQTALAFVGSLVWSAAVIRKKKYEGDLLKQRVRSLEIKNDALADLEKGLDDQLKMACETEAKILLDQNKISGYDNEFLERIKLSIGVMANLLMQGAEIHQPINAPEEVKNLFPDYKNLELVESKIKSLPKNTDANSK